MAGTSVELLESVQESLSKLPEYVESAQEEASALLELCSRFDRKELSAVEVTALKARVKRLQRRLFRIIGGCTAGAADILKIKTILRHQD